MKQKEKRKTSIISKIFDLILIIVLLVALYYAYKYYQLNNFNDFVRSEININFSQFSRDKNEIYTADGESESKGYRVASYKIDSPQYNDAMFYKKVKVKKNTPYRVTCMVKTRNVEAKDGKAGVGAQISIEGTTERSVAIAGTQDWQQIEFIFNSKDREEVHLGFRLGGYLGQAQGEAWFSNFTLEEGTAEDDNNWKFACFIFKNTDVNIDGEEIKLQVTQQDVKDITNTYNLFKTSVEEMSEGKMTAECDMYDIETPLSKLSYDDEFGYYASPEDVESQIQDIISTNDYDHIFIVVRLRRW